MVVYRITKRKYAQDLSGFGAYTYGGRWNRKGVSVLYTAMQRSLALLELLVHYNAQTVLHNDFVFLVLDIPDDWIYNVRNEASVLLKTNSRRKTQSLAPKYFVEQNRNALKVPSAIIPQESNILINPKTHDFERITTLEVEPLEIDQRLI